jgi:flagellar basal-body rod protein FlgC
MKVSASGLNAQRKVIQTVATNLANVHTTRTENGGPYLRKQAVLRSFLPTKWGEICRE